MDKVTKTHKITAIVAVLMFIAMAFMAIPFVPEGTMNAAATTPSVSKWITVQNLTFDTLDDQKHVKVDGDTTNLLIRTTGGVLNISATQNLTSSTVVFFEGFCGGITNFHIRYRYMTNSVYTTMVILRTSIVYGNSLRTYDSTGTSTATTIKAVASTFSDVNLVFDKGYHVFAYENGVEKINTTDYTAMYYRNDNNIISSASPQYAVYIQFPANLFPTNTSKPVYFEIDYLSEAVPSNDSLSTMNLLTNRWDDADVHFFENGLDICNQYGYHGTMSVISSTAVWTNVSKLVIYGWELADHTRDHPSLTSLALSDAENEIRWGKLDLEANLSYIPETWTPPGGLTNKTLDQYAESLGMRNIYMAGNYLYLSNDAMSDWANWNDTTQRGGYVMGHEVRNDIFSGSTYITTTNLTKVFEMWKYQKMIVVSFKELVDAAINMHRANFIENQTATNTTITIEGPASFAVVKVLNSTLKGKYVKDSSGNILTPTVVKDGFAFFTIYMKPKAVGSNYTETLTIEEPIYASSWIISTLSGITWYQWLWIVAFITVFMALIAVYASPKVNILPKKYFTHKRH